MAFKIPVVDRASTYPGRVTLTPVDGAENTFVMARADQPLVDGTPINKALLDNKAYTITEDVTVYVSKNGSTGGDGSKSYPFLTIQAALDALPKNLAGFTATIDIGAGTYEELVVCRGFLGGKLVIGTAGTAVVMRGLEIDACTYVEVNVPTFTAASKYGNALIDVKNGSTVFIPGNALLDGKTYNVAGIIANMGSVIYAAKYFTVTVNNTNSAAISASAGSKVALGIVAGTNNFLGLIATMGGTVTYETSTMDSLLGDNAQTGGSILTGGGIFNLAKASIE